MDTSKKVDANREETFIGRGKEAHSRAETKKKKGIWEKYTDRLKNSHCTRTPPECR